MRFVTIEHAGRELPGVLDGEDVVLLDAADLVSDVFLKAMERKGLLTPWQSGKLLKQEKDGYFLGGYRILYKIASGSFGSGPSFMK